MKHSVRLLDNYLSVYKQGGLVVTGREKVTLPSVLAEGSFDVKNMVREGQLEQVAAFYLMALKELWANCDNTFTNESITSCSLMLVNTYGDWHPKEIVIVLRNGLAGNYGTISTGREKVWGKVNTKKVLDWAREYNEVERAKYFENKDKGGELGWSEINPSVFKDIKIESIGKEKKQPTTTSFTPRSRTPQEQLIQDWMKEFDKMSFEESGKRWVKVDGVENNLDIEEYLQYKIANQ